MNYNPYKSFDAHAFWKNGVEKSDITFPSNIYNPKWKLEDTDKIATMGSCFAQHIANWLRGNGFNAPFYETEGFNEDEQTFSANYGNVYTVRQALQLVQESVGERSPSEVAWNVGDRFIDAMRPNSIKDKFGTSDAVIEARELHLNSVQAMVKDFDVLIFTLGLTEAWEIKSCGTIVPTAPGVLAGEFNADKYQFINFKYGEIMEDLNSLCELITNIRDGRSFKLLLTVSPVPLTATATDNHILLASTYSKGVLRSVAGDFVQENEFAEYFPSFEIITNPAAHSSFFEANLRSVKMSAVGNVMNVFSAMALENPRSTIEEPDALDPDCEDALLEEFSNEPTTALGTPTSIVCVGDSHLAGLRSPMLGALDVPPYFFPTNWSKDHWTKFDKNNYLTKFAVKNTHEHLIKDVPIHEFDTLVLVGMGLGGDAIIRCHGSLGNQTTRVPIKTAVNRGLIDFYKPLVDMKLQRVRRLDAHTSYKNIFWIVGPDICVDVAKVRLGEAFVNSGSYLIHKKAYWIAFTECLGGFTKTKFIFHDDSLCDPDTGFTLNEYRASENSLDIHCNSEFYKPSVAKIINGA